MVLCAARSKILLYGKVLTPRDAMGSLDIPGEIVELDTSLAGVV